MKKHIINRSVRNTAALTLALLTAMAALNTADAAYWNRSRNHRGGSDDSGGGSSSSSSSSQANSNSRGRDLDRDGIPNITDPDIDNDGIPNGQDPNVDGGIATSGPYRGKYIGDRLPNDHPAEKDIDDDGLPDDSAAELDIDGDGKADDSADELDIDGDGKADDSADELDIDGDGRSNDSPDELDIDGDGKADGSATETDTDGDGVSNSDDSDDDSDGIADSDDDDDEGDGHHDGVDDGDHTGNPPAAGPVGDGTAPAALTGLVYVVRDNNGVIEGKLNFSGATAGFETDPDGDKDPFTYTFTASGTTASLRLQFKTDKWDEYDLNYATGSIVRREFDKNALKDTDTGSFNLDGATPPPPPPSGGGTGTQVGDGTAPATIAGIKWAVSELNGHPEANLLFTSATAGSENDPDGDVDPFTYVYEANGASATLRLNFKPGKWDEYDLNVATGIYVRREFKNNALNDTDNGRFAVAVP